MICASDPLNEAFDVLRSTDLNDEIDIPPVDPKVERARGDNGAQLTPYHGGLDALTLLASKRSVVNANRKIVVVCKPKLVEKDLGLCPGVVKDQGGFVLLNLFQHSRNSVFAATTGPWR